MSDTRTSPAAYDPQPDGFSRIELPEDLIAVLEQLAQHNHDAWAHAKIQMGYRLGSETDDETKTHQHLVPYEALSEDVKELDRKTARRIIQVLLGLGYTIERRD